MGGLLTSTNKLSGRDRILEALAKATLEEQQQGLTFKDLLERVELARSILNRYLRELQETKSIERLPTVPPRYRLLELGMEIWGMRDDIQVISRSKKIQHEEIVPDGRVSVPQMLPIDASVYASSEIARLEQERAFISRKAVEISSDLAQLAKPAALMRKNLDGMFVSRFTDLAEDWLDYRLQEMQPTQRKRYLDKLYGTLYAHADDEERNWRSKSHEGRAMERKFPEGGPPALTFERVLDFETVVLFKVSREKIAEDRDRIRCALAAHLLRRFFHKDLLINASLMEPMAQSGIITSKEYQDYQRAKNDKKRMRILGELATKYAKLARPNYLGEPKTKTHHVNT